MLSKMFLPALLSVTRAAEALVLPSFHTLSNVLQSSTGADSSLPNIAVPSAWRDNASGVSTNSSLNSLSTSNMPGSNSLSAIGRGPVITCRPDYVHGVNPDSCIDAVSQVFSRDPNVYTWGIRGSATEADYYMPHRWVSCTRSRDSDLLRFLLRSIPQRTALATLKRSLGQIGMSLRPIYITFGLLPWQ